MPVELDNQVRGATADAIERLLSTAGRFVLTPPGSRRRQLVYLDVLQRFHDDAIGDQSLQRQGRAAVVMAGPPGAGKGFVLRGRADLAGYLTIDADRVKTQLLEHDVRSGRLDQLLARGLPDGAPVRPEELASLVHVESTYLADQMRQLALAEGFNVIIEGTLQWQGQGPRLIGELRSATYDHLELIAVEVPQDVAQRQALIRWWDGRVDPSIWGGGRYTPRGAIAAMYPDTEDPHSVCLHRAIDAFNLADVGALRTAVLTVHNRHGRGPEVQQFERIAGVYVSEIPRYGVLAIQSDAGATVSLTAEELPPYD